MRIAGDIDIATAPTDNFADIRELVIQATTALAYSLQPIEGKHATIKIMIDAAEDL